MEEHTFPLPPQQVHALDDLKNKIVHQRRPSLLARPWALLALGLGFATLVATLTKFRHKA
jgi:hypothetical protein